ncbi:MAG: Serine/threonine-protein kinase PknB [Deltaproteobacteria bacterium ADurb.Bin207]|nr:MAG: Serine/threonine-protein kinase PknB [Deltaproteobacteria bacterium ADurb.Bin207]
MNRMPLIGSTIDHRYQLYRELAVGGMATIYEAKHLYTERRFAIKILHKNNATNRARLLREASALQGERHHSLIDVTDAGESPEVGPYLVMELLKGRSLEAMLAARQTLYGDEVVQIGLELCDALAFVHQRGMIHRDIKPGNIFLIDEKPYKIKLIDFGIVSTPFGEKLTKESAAPGTPEYMSPEHIRQESIDRRSDIYSLGVTLFECLTGSVPVSGTYNSIFVHFSKPCSITKVRDIRSDTPLELATVIERAIAPVLDDRFQDMREFSNALREITNLPSRREAHTTPQRRVFRRAPYGTPVRLIRSNGNRIDGRSEDISEGGMLLLVECPLNVGETIHVRFASPVVGSIVTVSSIVRWVRTSRGGKTVLGCSFNEISGDLRRDISRYVEWMSDPNSAPTDTNNLLVSST